jgi:hypothetical protein
MSSKLVEKEFVDAIAEQVASCVDDAVERWMAEFDSVLQDPHLTALGKLQAITAIVARYRHLRGRGESPMHRTTRAAGRGVC